MSNNQIFSPVGILPPFKGTIPEGATVMDLLNSTASKAFTEGEVVRLVAEGTDDVTLTPQTRAGFVDFDECSAPASNDNASGVATGCFGCLLEDIADGARGLLLVRGDLVVVDVDGNGATIVTDIGLYPGGGASVDHLRSVSDLAAGETVKVIARSRNATNITTAGAKCAVMFDGISGFGTIQGL